MKPTQEQLNDPKWWDDNAPDGAEYYCSVFYSALGSELYCYNIQKGWRKSATGCLSPYAVRRPTKPAFVPNTETKTIYWVAEVDSYGTPWNIDGPHDDYESAENSISLLLLGGSKGRKLIVTSMSFSPIKSERELFVDVASKILQLHDQDTTDLCNKSVDMFRSQSEALYDSGKFKLVETTK